jgi:two-component system NtrC family sensor kinase
MANEKKYLATDRNRFGVNRTANHLKVLIAGGPEALHQSSEILDSLLSIGYGVNLLGVVDQGGDRLFSEDLKGLDESPIAEFERLLHSDPPDLLIITSDDYALRKGLIEIVAPHTRVLDSFALKLFQAIKEVTGQLASTRHRLESVEIIKAVLMDDAETSIMVVDDELKIQDINNALLRRAKASRHGCLDRPCHWAIKGVMEPCYEKGQTCVAREVLSTGRPVHTLQEDVRRDRPSKWFNVSAYPLKEDQRGKKSALLVWKDVTKGVNAALSRQERNIREDFAHYLQQDKMIALGKLAAAAVHEINNPVQGILTFAKLMRSSLDGESLGTEEIQRFRSYLDMIATESERCGKILMNLLSFSRRGELKKSLIDLERVFDEILLLMGNQLELAGVLVDLEFTEKLPNIYGDRDQIKQALLNLLLNAVEAMPTGGRIAVSCGVRSESGHVQIVVTDTGTGIPEEIKANIFEPFFTTKQNGKGVGLGLSVVYGIVLRHGGAIELESEEGKGATFILTLPPAHESGEHEEDGASTASAV